MGSNLCGPKLQPFENFIMTKLRQCKFWKILWGRGSDSESQTQRVPPLYQTHPHPPEHRPSNYVITRLFCSQGSCSQQGGVIVSTTRLQVFLFPCSSGRHDPWGSEMRPRAQPHGTSVPGESDASTACPGCCSANQIPGLGGQLRQNCKQSVAPEGSEC